MCGPTSAIGLAAVEREHWPELRERLRQPGHLMAMMRGIIGGDAEVAVVAAVTPEGVVHPVAILVTPEIAEELSLPDDRRADEVIGAVGGDDVTVLLGNVDGEVQPVALRVNSWIFHNLTLYARKLWTSRFRTEGLSHLEPPQGPSPGNPPPP